MEVLLFWKCKFFDLFWKCRKGYDVFVFVFKWSKGVKMNLELFFGELFL